MFGAAIRSAKTKSNTVFSLNRKHNARFPTIYSSFSTSSTQAAKPWLVTWGSNDYNGLCLDKEEPYQSTLKRIGFPHVSPDNYKASKRDTVTTLTEAASESEFEGMVDVACGWASNVALTSTGAVYQWGYNKRMQNLLSTMKAERSSPLLKRMFRVMPMLNVKGPGERRPTRVPLLGAQTIAQLREDAREYKVVLPEDDADIDLNMYRAIKVASGPDVHAAITATGHVFTWHNHDDFYGVAGRGASQAISLADRVPRHVTDLTSRAVQIAFGFNHMAILTENGELFTCGLLASGALGLPGPFVNAAKATEAISPPLSVHASLNLFVSDMKQAMIAQQQRAGQLSRERNPVFSAVREKEEKFAASDASLQAKEKFIANVENAMQNKGGAMKEGTANVMSQVSNNEVVSLPKFIDVACGFGHTAMIDEAGSVWTCGRNSHGELGLVLDPLSEEGRGLISAHEGVNTGLTPVDFKLNYIPTRVDTLDVLGVKAVKIACGHHHTVILSDKGDVYTWGSTEYGQCGRMTELPSTLKRNDIRKQPWALPPGLVHISKSVLQGCTIVDVFAGFYDTVILLSDGRTVWFGSHLSDRSPARAPFMMQEFEPLDQIKRKHPKYLVQTLSTKDIAPPGLNAYAQEQKTGPNSCVSRE